MSDPRPQEEQDQGFVRAPKQERSRRSFERAVDAAVALLGERRSDSFTLAEVAERAGVSIGSIYGRVGSKDDLLRAAQARELARITAGTRRAFAEGAAAEERLPETVSRVVRTTAALLRADADVLDPFMRLANRDPVIADAGRAGYQALVEEFRGALLTRRGEIRHADPEHAADWSCAVVYSVLARWLGLGGDVAAAEEGDWNQVLADLTTMVAAYLGSPSPAGR